jgi:hypothetical protein
LLFQHPHEVEAGAMLSTSMKVDRTKTPPAAGRTDCIMEQRRYHQIRIGSACSLRYEHGDLDQMIDIGLLGGAFSALMDVSFVTPGPSSASSAQGPCVALAS